VRGAGPRGEQDLRRIESVIREQGIKRKGAKAQSSERRIRSGSFVPIFASFAFGLIRLA
jgi:hypothetical protein